MAAITAHSAACLHRALAVTLLATWWRLPTVSAHASTFDANGVRRALLLFAWVGSEYLDIDTCERAAAREAAHERGEAEREQECWE